MRRAALGVLRIVLECRLDLDLPELLRAAAAAQPVQRAGVVEEVYDFIAERLRGLLLEQPGTTPEMLDAVFANRPRSPLDAVTRLTALQEFLRLPDAAVLAAINKRIANILKKTQLRAGSSVDSQALTEEAEIALHRAIRELREPVLEATHQRRYAEGLRALVGLQAPVNDFFDQVMVMDEDIVRRNNRLALLRDAQILLGRCGGSVALAGLTVQPMQLFKSLFFTAYMMVSALLFGGFMTLLFWAPYRTQFAIARTWARILFWVLKKVCGLTFTVEGRERIPRRQSHRHEQSHLRLGNHRAIFDFPAAGLGAEAGTAVDTPDRLGLEAAAAHLDQPRRGSSSSQPSHRAGQGAAGGRPVDHHFPGGHAGRGGREAQVRRERRAAGYRDRQARGAAVAQRGDFWVGAGS